MAEPGACPFCGNDRVATSFVSDTGGNVRCAVCRKCRAHGPWADRNDPDVTRRDPVVLWNRRAASPTR